MCNEVSRRVFTAMAAAGVAAAGGAQAQIPRPAPAVPVRAADVDIKTPDGVCDAALLRPAGEGAFPAVIVYPDAFGLRPAFREMAARLAGEGFCVLVINQYYRLTRAPAVPDDFDFNVPADRAKLATLRAPLTPEAVARDAVALIGFLDAQPFVNAKAKAGVVGYCMGGAMTMRAAAAAPDRIGAGASFHGGGLVTKQPDSPHLLVPKIKAAFYFGVAVDDDRNDPKAKIVLREAFAEARVPATIEVYRDAAHGWAVTDMTVYSPRHAERAFTEMVALYKHELA